MEIVVPYGTEAELANKPTRVLTFVGRAGADADLGYIIANFMTKVEANNKFSLFESMISANAYQIQLRVTQTDFDLLGNRVSVAETKITQTAQSITLLATKADFDSLGGRLSLAEASIVVNANSITSKVSQSDFNALGERVSFAETSLTQTKDQIKLLATQSTIDSLTGRISTMEGSLVVTNSLIASKVSQTDFNSATGEYNTRFSSIEQNAAGIITIVQGLPTRVEMNNSIGNIQVGGRNLIVDSSFTRGLLNIEGGTAQSSIQDTNVDGLNSPVAYTRVLRVTGEAGDRYTTLNRVIPVVAGKEYILSFYYSEAGAKTNTSSYLYLIGNSQIPIIQLPVNTGNSTTWKVYSQVFVFPTGTTGVKLRFGFGANNYAWLAVTLPKLEEGNKRTDWTPNPEDVQGYADDAISEYDEDFVRPFFETLSTRITQNESAIQLRATQAITDSLGNRITAAEGELTIQAGLIQSKVSQSDFNALGGRVSSAESRLTQTESAITLMVTKSTVDSLTGRVATTESQLSIQAGQITSKVSSQDFNGATIVSMINQTPDTIKILAKNIQLEGAVTASSLNSGRTKINVNPKGDFEFFHLNNKLGFRLTTDEAGRAIFQAFNDAGEKVFDIDTWSTGGIKYVTTVPESFAERKLRLVTATIDSTQTQLQNIFNVPSGTCRVNNPENPNYNSIGINRSIIAFYYSPGINAQAATNAQYEGYKVFYGNKNANIADGWYVTGDTYLDTYPTGGYYIQFMKVQGGKVVEYINGVVTGNGVHDCTF